MNPLKKNIALLALFVALIPFSAAAQPATDCAPYEYHVLVKIGIIPDCVELTSYLNGIFQTIIGIAGILAVVMIVICGIKLMTSGSAGGKSEAKECIWNALFGVLLAASSWILLNTINPFLVSNSPRDLISSSSLIPSLPSLGGPVIEAFPTVPGWYYRLKDSKGNITNSQQYNNSDFCFQVQKAVEASTGGVGTVQTNPIGKVGCWQVFSASAPLNPSEAAIRTALCGNTSCVNQAPIGINKQACAFEGAHNCTNVEGLSPSAVAAIQNLQAACGCNVVITGGTEYWEHDQSAGCLPTSCHKSGNGVFDLRYDGDVTALANIIKSGTKKPSFKGNTRWLYNGFWYTDESSAITRHWHTCPDGSSASYCK